MNKIFILWCAVITTLSTAVSAFAQDSLQLQSPNGKIQFHLSVAENGELNYTVYYQQKEIIKPSALGVDGWWNGLYLQSVAFSKRDTLWKPVYGERSLVRDKYQAKIFTFLKDKDEKRCLQIEVRAYDEGIAFRYCFPEHPSGGRDIAISKDLTEFALPAETRAWFTDHAQGSYQLLPLNKWPSEAERPLTLELNNGLYAALAEAEVVDYCRTKFVLHATKSNTIACSMYDKVELTTPFATPWRVIMIAEKATQLLQGNDLILNLNEPCAIENTNWIKPGKIIRETSLSTSGAKEVVDFAVKRHLQYIHFDAGWYGFEYASASDASAVNVDPRRNPKNDLNLPEVIRYAKESGVGLFLYVNQRALARQLDSLLPLYEKWGVSGIKFGFVHVGSHRWTTWLHEAVKKCAQYHLMVDIHDEYRPTGFSRTYPNLLTQEGVRGNEEMPDATNNATLPFTRFIAGAADYTICYYNRPGLKAGLPLSRSLKTTAAHQLALSVIYYSPLQFMYWYDRPADAQGEPELEFFDKVPTVWDDTRVLDGEIAKYITIARRRGQEWFVGSITNNNARELKIPLNFLPEGKVFEASIYVDDTSAQTRTKVAIRRIKVDARTVLDSHLIASGGLAIWLRPIFE